MRNWKLALVAAALVAPLGTLNARSEGTAPPAAVAVAPGAVVLESPDGQGWACCWVFVMGRWMCLPC